VSGVIGKARELHDAIVYKQKIEKQSRDETVAVGSGMALGIGIMAGAVFLARALAKK
jgi:hypothetical protein